MPSPRAFARNSPDNKRLTIVALDAFDDDKRIGAVRAHYNPKEVQIDKTVTWNEHKTTAHSEPDYQYTSGNPRTMQMELFFDVAEVKGAHIEGELEALQLMTVVVDPKGKAPERRPPLLKVINGPIGDFKCVLESLLIKVTMFDRDMHPVRATVTVKLKELRRDGNVLKPNAARGPASPFMERDGTNWQAADEADIKRARNDAMADRGNVERARQGKPPISQSERELLDNLE